MKVFTFSKKDLNKKTISFDGSFRMKIKGMVTPKIKQMIKTLLAKKTKVEKLSAALDKANRKVNFTRTLENHLLTQKFDDLWNQALILDQKIKIALCQNSDLSKESQSLCLKSLTQTLLRMEMRAAEAVIHYRQPVMMGHCHMPSKKDLAAVKSAQNKIENLMMLRLNYNG